MLVGTCKEFYLYFDLFITVNVINRHLNIT